MNDESWACHKQMFADDGHVYCTIAVSEYDDEPHEHRTNSVFCKHCEFGKAARAIKCPYLDGTATIIDITGDTYAQSDVNFYCIKKQSRIPHPKLCLECTIRDDADFALPTIEAATLLEAVGCGKAATFLREALELLNAPVRIEVSNKEVVNKTANALASALNFLVGKYGKTTGKSNIKDLWDEYVRAAKYDPEASRYNFITDAIMQKIQLIRHKESDAHPAERTPTETETRFHQAIVSAIIHHLVRTAGEDGKL